jgi:hypothetical protein
MTAAKAAASVRLPGRIARPLDRGNRLTFGRGGQERPVDLHVSDSPRVSRWAGSVELTPYGVLVSNTGSNPLLLRLDGEPTPVALRPGHSHLVTAGKARVDFPGVSDYLDVEALTPEPVRLDRRPETAAEQTNPAFPIAPGTAYFHCLVALCEPTLRNPRSPWIPTSRQIAARLYECGLTPAQRTGDWVDRRLDDVRAKLPIGEQTWSAGRALNADDVEQRQAVVRARSGAPRRSARKEQLVEFAIAHGLVTIEVVWAALGK